MASVAEMTALEDEVKQEIEDAVVFAKDSPFPDPSETTTEVYSSDNERSVAR